MFATMHTLAYAAHRANIEELLQVRAQMEHVYGKEFVNASETDANNINETIRENINLIMPDNGRKVARLVEINKAQGGSYTPTEARALVFSPLSSVGIQSLHGQQGRRLQHGSFESNGTGSNAHAHAHAVPRRPRATRLSAADIRTASVSAASDAIWSLQYPQLSKSRSSPASLSASSSAICGSADATSSSLPISSGAGDGWPRSSNAAIGTFSLSNVGRFQSAPRTNRAGT